MANSFAIIIAFVAARIPHPPPPPMCGPHYYFNRKCVTHLTPCMHVGVYACVCYVCKICELDELFFCVFLCFALAEAFAVRPATTFAKFFMTMSLDTACPLPISLFLLLSPSHYLTLLLSLPPPSTKYDDNLLQSCEVHLFYTL